MIAAEVVVQTYHLRNARYDARDYIAFVNNKADRACHVLFSHPHDHHGRESKHFI